MCLIIITIFDFNYSDRKFVDLVVQIPIINHQFTNFYFIILFLDHLLFVLTEYY